MPRERMKDQHVAAFCFVILSENRANENLANGLQNLANVPCVCVCVCACVCV